MDKYDFQAQEVAHDSAMPGRLDPSARAVIAAALRESAAEAREDMAKCFDSAAGPNPGEGSFPEFSKAMRYAAIQCRAANGIMPSEPAAPPRAAGERNKI